MAATKKAKVAWPVLKLNDSCAEIKQAQQMLQKLGSTVKATGEFTIGMMTAVKSFQKKNGLPVTGKIDKKTWDKMYAMTHPVKRTTTKKK